MTADESTAADGGRSSVTWRGAAWDALHATAEREQITRNDVANNAVELYAHLKSIGAHDVRAIGADGEAVRILLF